MGQKVLFSWCHCNLPLVRSVWSVPKHWVFLKERAFVDLLSSSSSFLQSHTDGILFCWGHLLLIGHLLGPKLSGQLKPDLPFHWCLPYAGIESCPQELSQGLSSSSSGHISTELQERDNGRCQFPLTVAPSSMLMFFKLPSLGLSHTGGEEKHIAPCPLGQLFSSISLSLSPFLECGLKKDDRLGFLKISFSKP